MIHIEKILNYLKKTTESLQLNIVEKKEFPEYILQGL